MGVFMSSSSWQLSHSLLFLSLTHSSLLSCLSPPVLSPVLFFFQGIIIVDFKLSIYLKKAGMSVFLINICWEASAVPMWWICCHFALACQNRRDIAPCSTGLNARAQPRSTTGNSIQWTSNKSAITSGIPPALF